MAELTSKVRLQPSLLDRLTDLEPDKKMESRERRVLSPAQLRQSVQRDLAWLFNAIRLEAVCDLGAYPEVAKSVLNFGFPDLAGRTVSSIEVPTLERILRKVIWEFEPRLLRESVKVTLSKDPDHVGHNALRFDIEADLWSDPIPIRLYLRTDIDLEDGTVRVSEPGASTPR
jgi:type VI secretion system protein ImpF